MDLDEIEQATEEVADTVAPGAGGFGTALLRLGAAVAREPWVALPAAATLTSDVLTAGARTAALMLGRPTEPVVAPPRRDRRFADSSWTTNPWFFGVSQAYLAWAKCLREVAESADLDPATAMKANLAVDAVVDAMAPTNYLPTNPAALRKAVETRGVSVLEGLANLLNDLVTNDGRPSQVDRSAFTVGENLAATPGKVVFRNELMELIQYSPQTGTVFEVPLLLSPPWINKYYVMDLAPGRSFVEWAVTRGHTVFVISYRDPDESMRDVSLDDYLLSGLGTAVDVVREITGAEEVNVVGLCVGGTLAVMLQAWLAAGDEKDGRIRSVTLLNTLIDFSSPGDLGAFTDAASVERLERGMAEHGYLEAREMATTFDALRANDLIWNYVSSSWLMGDPPPAFDILAWNADATRVSEATHSFYLRACYLENQLAKGIMTLAGRPLVLDEIESDFYVLAAAEDHITPWKSSYMTTGLLPGPLTFVLSSSGHIAGIVNPPGPKRRYWTNDDVPGNPDEWLAAATEHAGSWWENWAEWIAARAGDRRKPPRLGSDAHPVLGDAPGTYVHMGSLGPDNDDSSTSRRNGT